MNCRTPVVRRSSLSGCRYNSTFGAPSKSISLNLTKKHIKKSSADASNKTPLSSSLKNSSDHKKTSSDNDKTSRSLNKSVSFSEEVVADEIVFDDDVSVFYDAMADCKYPWAGDGDSDDDDSLFEATMNGTLDAYQKKKSKISASPPPTTPLPCTIEMTSKNDSTSLKETIDESINTASDKQSSSNTNGQPSKSLEKPLETKSNEKKISVPEPTPLSPLRRHESVAGRITTTATTQKVSPPKTVIKVDPPKVVLKKEATIIHFVPPTSKVVNTTPTSSRSASPRRFPRRASTTGIEILSSMRSSATTKKEASPPPPDQVAPRVQRRASVSTAAPTSSFKTGQQTTKEDKKEEMTSPASPRRPSFQRRALVSATTTTALEKKTTKDKMEELSSPASPKKPSLQRRASINPSSPTSSKIDQQNSKDKKQELSSPISPKKPSLHRRASVSPATPTSAKLHLEKDKKKAEQPPPPPPFATAPPTIQRRASMGATTATPIKPKPDSALLSTSCQGVLVSPRRFSRSFNHKLAVVSDNYVGAVPSFCTIGHSDKGQGKDRALLSGWEAQQRALGRIRRSNSSCNAIIDLPASATKLKDRMKMFEQNKGKGSTNINKFNVNDDSTSTMETASIHSFMSTTSYDSDT